MTPQVDGAADPQAEPARQAIRTRTVVIGLAVGIPISALFLWLAIRGVDLSRVWQVVRDANPLLVVLAIPFACGLFVFQALRWRHLVEADPRPGRKTFVALMFVGGAITNVVPGRPGDVARGIWLARLGRIPVARSLTSVGVDRAADVVTLFIILVACLPFVDKPDWLVNLVIIGAGLTAVGAIVLALAWWYANRSHHGQERSGLERDQKSWLRHHLSGIVQGLAVLSRPRDFAAAFALSFAGWASAAFAAWLVAWSIGIDLSATSVLFVVAVLSLGAAIPSSPGMIGTYQWLAVTSMAVVGVGQADALAFSILSQATWYIPVTLSGPFAAWWLTSLERRRQATNTAPLSPAR